MDGKGSTVYWLSYPNPSAKRIKLRISNGQLAAADQDNIGAQNAICQRYKMAVGLPKEFHVSWIILRRNFESTKDKQDTKEARKQANKQKRGQVKDWYPDVDEGLCRCQCIHCDLRGVHCCNRETGCKASNP
jgi:hypothetical protein